MAKDHIFLKRFGVKLACCPTVLLVTCATDKRSGLKSNVLTLKI